MIAERFMGCRGVVQLLDAFCGSVPNKCWCLVYDFHGISLADVLHEGPLPVKAVRDVFLDVLTGIECVHKAGFLHADVKPPNILVRKGGHEPGGSGWSAVVGDLGTAVKVFGKGLSAERIFASTVWVFWCVHRLSFR